MSSDFSPGAVAEIVLAVIAIIAWFMRLENRLTSTMTREEHEKVCMASRTALDKRLDELKKLIEERDREDREFRHEMRDELNRISIAIAVLTREGENDREQRKIDNRSKL